MRQKGFTLVELAIVLMIIGLLIGGILRGQELLTGARIKSTIQQIKAYQGAYVTFQDAYGSLPGDMPNASTKIPGCESGNGNYCVDGNGDGKIGLPLSPAASIDGPSENVQFWKQLALAHLITGVNPADNPNVPSGWGGANPVAKINGGFKYIYMDYGITGDTSRPSWVGSFIRLQPNASGPMEEVEGQYALSPKQASQIDRLMDDGQPGTGDVLSFDAGVAPASGRCEMPNPYDEWSDRLNCVIVIRM